MPREERRERRVQDFGFLRNGVERLTSLPVDEARSSSIFLPALQFQPHWPIFIPASKVV